MRHAACLIAAGLLAACATTPEVDPVAVKLNDVDARVGRVEAVVNNQSLVDLSRRLDALEAQMRSLRGAIEESQNAGTQQAKQQRDLYADLARRIGALEMATRAAAEAPPSAVAATPAPAPRPQLPPAPTASTATGALVPTPTPTPAGVPASAATSGRDQADYDRALAALRAGKYAESIAVLRNFAAEHPGTTLADNAQYWLGESYYVTDELDQAAAAFRSVGERWPASRKAPDALLKLGYTQQKQGDTKAARTTLQQVVIRHPDSDAAKLARERLLQLTAESR